MSIRFQDQFFWSESRRLGNGTGVGGGGGLGGSGASWGVSFRDTLRRSCKPSQEKHRTGKVSEPLSSYPLGARSQADMPMW